MDYNPILQAIPFALLCTAALQFVGHAILGIFALTKKKINVVGRRPVEARAVKAVGITLLVGGVLSLFTFGVAGFIALLVCIGIGFFVKPKAVTPKFSYPPVTMAPSLSGQPVPGQPVPGQPVPGQLAYPQPAAQAVNPSPFQPVNMTQPVEPGGFPPGWKPPVDTPDQFATGQYGGDEFATQRFEGDIFATQRFDEPLSLEEHDTPVLHLFDQPEAPAPGTPEEPAAPETPVSPETPVAARSITEPNVLRPEPILIAPAEPLKYSAGPNAEQPVLPPGFEMKTVPNQPKLEIPVPVPPAPAQPAPVPVVSPAPPVHAAPPAAANAAYQQAVNAPTSLMRPQAPQPQPPQVDVSSAPAWLEVIESSLGLQRLIPLPAGDFEIGRAKGNDLQLLDEYVSRRHASIRFAQGMWFIQDKGSKSGIQINNKPDKAARINTGDVITIGISTFVFHINE